MSKYGNIPIHILNMEFDLNSYSPCSLKEDLDACLDEEVIIDAKWTLKYDSFYEKEVINSFTAWTEKYIITMIEGQIGNFFLKIAKEPKDYV